MKKCSKCKQPKPIEDFYRNRYQKDGVDSYCKPCRKVYDLNYLKSDRPRGNGVYISSSEKTCSKCNQVKPVSDFNKKSRAWDGLRSYCRECQSESDKGRIRRPSPHPRPKQWSKELIEKTYRAPKRKFVELAGGECQRCGYKEFMPGLSWHHVNPGEKQSGPSVLMQRSFKIAYEELDKCILLCQNCHFSLERGYWQAEFIKRDGLGYTLK